MKGDSQVLSYLNQALKQELTAINQYFLHAKMFENMGLQAALRARAQGIDRRDEACRRARRAHPVPRRPAEPAGPRKLLIGENVPEMLGADLQARACGAADATGSHRALRIGRAITSRRELLEDILESEEEHIDWLETQLELIDKVGVQNYLQSQMS